jgi:hypothetical protein
MTRGSKLSYATALFHSSRTRIPRLATVSGFQHTVWQNSHDGRIQEIDILPKPPQRKLPHLICEHKCRTKWNKCLKRAFSADVARPSSLASPTRRSAAILQRLRRSLRGGSHRIEQFPEEDDRSAQDFAQCGAGRSWLVLVLSFPNDAGCSSCVVSVKSRMGLKCIEWISEVSEVGRRRRAWAAVMPMMGRSIVHGSRLSSRVRIDRYREHTGCHQYHPPPPKLVILSKSRFWAPEPLSLSAVHQPTPLSNFQLPDSAAIARKARYVPQVLSDALSFLKSHIVLYVTSSKAIWRSQMAFAPRALRAS